MASFSIPVSELRQHCFCPRIPYFHLLMQLPAEGRPWLSQGISYYKRTEMLSKRRNLSHYELTKSSFVFEADIRLYDPDLGLHGICDGVIRTAEGNIYPLEFKVNENASRTPGAAIQLAAYAMLLESREGRSITRGFIIAGDRGKTFAVDIDLALRENVLKTADAIRKACESALLPASAATDKKCCQCEYANHCADRY